MAVSPLAVALSMQQPVGQTPRASVQPTDVLGAYNLSTQAANQQYLAKLQQQNSLWGGLAGLGGSALTASILKGKLFGGAAPGATTTAADATGLGLPIDLGSPVMANGMQTGILGVGPTAQGLTDATGAMAPGVPLAGLAPPVADAGVPLAGLAPPVTDAAGTAAADLGTTAAADAAGSIGTDLAAEGATDAAATLGADAGTVSLADLLPFLFAAA